MFASTLEARKILKLALKAADSHSSNTYTEKTSKLDPSRRSVVFPCDTNVEKALEIASKMFKEAGYTKSVPYMTSKDYFGSYIRVIAYIE
jgi:hypothetical protein